ncbi:MAG: glycosyltransferase family 4 protein [Pseudolabrys sp.]
MNVIPPRLLYLVSEDWYFLSHRLPMARSAKAAGYEVHVATHVVNCAQQIIAEGFYLHPIRWRRGSLNPFYFLATIIQARRLYRRIRPDIVHHVALVPTVVGSIASLGLPLARLNAFAGLGYIFTSSTLRARLVRLLASPLLGWLLNRPATTVLVQNPDDQAVAIRIGVLPEKIALVPGSGVDIDILTPMPEPAGAFTIGYVGRLLDDKGVPTLVRAHEILSERGIAVRTLLAGTPDPSNPASIPGKILSSWRNREGLVLLGHVDDVRTVWAQAHVGILPSRREGLPKSLLEAAACSRPLIATDVPGCREIARQGLNALLVPIDDPVTLANAIEVLMKDPKLRQRFGQASRQLVTEKFSSDRIGREIVALYNRLLFDALDCPT